MLSVINKRIIGVLLPLLIVVGLVVIFSNNPMQTNWYPKCPTYLFLDFHCFGCGATRALYALVHADFLLAFRQNIFAVLALPYLGYELGRMYLGGFWNVQIPQLKIPISVQVLLPILLIIFVILRNIPLYPFILLAPIE